MSLEIDLDLSRCSALELRQLQHFVEACKYAAANLGSSNSSSRNKGGAGKGDGKEGDTSDQQARQQQEQQQQEQQQQEGEGEAKDAAKAAVNTEMVDAAPTAEAKAAAGMPEAAADAAKAPEGPTEAVGGKQQPQADTAGATPPQQQPGDTPAAAGVAEAIETAAAAAAAAEGQDDARRMSGFPLGGAAESSLSAHAGISWPGVLVGAGLKPCSRMHLTGDPEKQMQLGMAASAAAAANAAAAAAVAAAAGAGGPTAHQSMFLPPRGPLAFAGLKRRSSGVCGGWGVWRSRD
jgi:hypothetical protein